MSRSRSFLYPLVLTLGLASAPAVPQTLDAPSPMRGAPSSFADVAAPLLDAVVNISTSQTVEAGRSVPTPQAPPGTPFEDFFEEFFNRDRNRPDGNRPDGEGQQRQQPQQQQPSRRVSSLGSGFVIDPEGYVVTNNHVIQDADEVTVNFNDGSKLKAKVLGADSKTDLALLKVESPKPLKSVRFGDSQSMRIGDWVMAIGNPFGLGGSLTVGVISAINRDIQSGPYDNFIQTDASINRGNSGGPLFSLKGEVIGINTAIISPSGGSIGIGFSIPSVAAMSVLDQLRKFGKTQRGWLGVRIQSVTENLAESLGVVPPRGALVSSLTEKGPAEEAKILVGDVIVEFDGKPVPSIRDLPRMVADTPVDKMVSVKVIRKGQEVSLTAKLRSLEDNEPRPTPARAVETPRSDRIPSQKVLGLSLAPITSATRREFNLGRDATGVVVTAVDQPPAGADSSERVNVGDVIMEVSAERVTTPADVERRIEALKKEGKKSALLMVSNAQGDQRFVALPIP